MSSHSRRPSSPQGSTGRGPEVGGKSPPEPGLSPLESAQLKDAIRKRAQKIEELVRKDPSKAAKILSDWINSAQSSKKSTALPAKGPLRRKSD